MYRTYLSAFLIVILASFPLSSSAQLNDKGPRVDELLIRIPPYDWSEIDIMQQNVDPSNPPPGAILEQYGITSMCDIEINNNMTISSYSNWTSPTWDIGFRQAISHLADKERYIIEVLNGYGIALNTPVMPWLKKWYNPDAPQYSYNPTIAAQKLDAAGYTMGPTELRVYPPWHEKAGQPLDPLIFYARSDDLTRSAIAQMFANELASIGIPVDLRLRTASEIRIKVLQERDYHLYVGGFQLLRDPEYLYDLYHTNPLSKDLISDPELDQWLELLESTSDESTVVTSAYEAQHRLLEIAATIPLFAQVGVKAYKDGWAGIVNENGTGIDCWWTFLNAWPTSMEKPWTMRYGISSDIFSLNPLYASWHNDWIVLKEIYDQLIRENPYDPSQDLSWIAKDWNITTWTDFGDEPKTKLIFHLNENITWHPRMLPVLTPLTAYDVKFTVEYIKNCTDSWLYKYVKDVHHVETPDEHTVIVYENISSYWTFHYIGELPILPKHVWETILDPHGFMPDPMLTGSGPFKFESYVAGEYVKLNANHNYFMPHHPRGDINFDKKVNILDCIIMSNVFGSDDLKADLNGDHRVNILDCIILAQDFGMQWMPDP